MEEKHLARYFLFRRLGAFSIVREEPRKALESLDYAKGLISKHQGSVWIFPQGEIVPAGKRPIEFYRGIERLVTPNTRSLTCVAIVYAFGQDPKPDVYVRSKQNSELTEPVEAEKLAIQMSEQVGLIENDIAFERHSEYKKIV